MTARDLLAAATPRPWRDAKTMGAIVSDDPAAVTRRGEENLRGYGGAIVCESAERPDRVLIIAAVNEYEALVNIADAFSRYATLLGAVEDDSDITAYNDAVDALDRLDALRSGTS